MEHAASVVGTAREGRELTGSAIFGTWGDSAPTARAKELLAQMYADVPASGIDIAYGESNVQKCRFWKTLSGNAPLILFVHGGSWRSGTYLDSVGSRKVDFLTEKGFAFASVNYTLFPNVTVARQVQEVANALACLLKNAADLQLDPARIFLMGHSSGAHVVTLLGTDTSYFEQAGVDIDIIRGVISLDGSNYNAMAEIVDSPGDVAENALLALGSDIAGLKAMSPTYHAHGPNAHAFLLLHVQRAGDIRQAIEFEAVLRAAQTDVELHVFEGEGFEGHMQMLLRLGDPDYPATNVLERWLQRCSHAKRENVQAALISAPA